MDDEINILSKTEELDILYEKLIKAGNVTEFYQEDMNSDIWDDDENDIPTIKTKVLVLELNALLDNKSVGKIPKKNLIEIVKRNNIYLLFVKLDNEFFCEFSPYRKKQRDYCNFGFSKIKTPLRNEVFRMLNIDKRVPMYC